MKNLGVRGLTSSNNPTPAGGHPANKQEIVMMNKIQEAAQEYLNRQNRISHPDGRFDNGGRFYLAENEQCDCCKSIRTPSRSYPYSQMTHGRTMLHVANLFGVKVGEVRKAVKEFKETA